MPRAVPNSGAAGVLPKPPPLVPTVTPDVAGIAPQYQDLAAKYGAAGALAVQQGDIYSGKTEPLVSTEMKVKVSYHLSLRASKLPMNFAQTYPQEAAALITSGLPTSAIAQVAAAYHEALTLVQQRTIADGVPGYLSPYYQMAFNAPTSEAQGDALVLLDKVRKLPESVQLAGLNEIMPSFDALVNPTSILKVAAGAAGKGLMLPFEGAGAVGGGVLSGAQAGLTATGNAAGGVPIAGGLIKDVALGTEGALSAFHTGAGLAAKYGGEGAMYALNVASNVAATSLRYGLVLPEAVMYAQGNRETPWDTFTKYVPTWSEFEAGAHTGGTNLFFDITGLDQKDYGGLAAGLDFLNYIATGEGIARTAMDIRTIRQTPASAGGRFTGEEFVSRRHGGALMDKAWETLTDSHAPTGPARSVWLNDHFKGMDPELATELGRATTKDEMVRAFVRVIDEVPTPAMFDTLAKDLEAIQREEVALRNEATAGNAAEYAARREGTGQLDIGTPVPNEQLRSLAARRIAKEQELRDLGHRAEAPVFRYPKYSRLKAIANDAGGGVISRALGFVFRSNRSFAPGKGFDDLSQRDQVLFNGTIASAPPDWQVRNVTALRKNFNIAKVPEELQRQVIGDMANITTRQEFYDWRLQVADAFKVGLTRRGRRVLTPDGEAVVTFYQRELVERMKSRVSTSIEDPVLGRVSATRDVVETLDKRPMPSSPDEMIGHAELPNIEQLRSAGNSIKYLDNWMKSKPFMARLGYQGLRLPVDVAKFIGFTIPRLILRPVLLLSRILPMGTKIQLDQGLRNWALDMPPIGIWKRRDLTPLPGGIVIKAHLRGVIEAAPNKDAGMFGIIADELNKGERYTHTLATRGIDVNLDVADAVTVVRAVYDRITQFRNSELTRMIAMRGPERTLAYLKEHPETPVARQWAEYKTEILDRPDVAMSPEQYLAMKDLEIRQYTSDTPALRSGIGIHKWKRDAPPVEPGVSMELELQTAKLEEARKLEVRARAENDPVLRSEAARQYRITEARIEKLKAETDDGTILQMSDRDAVQNAMLEDWRDGKWTPPDEVLASRRALPPEENPTQGMTLQQRIKYYATKDQILRPFMRINKTLYGGLRPLSFADVRLTRGSTYYTQLVKITNQLVASGRDPALAFRIAQYRAAFITADLHYDLSARSSFDRASKDIFWFAPVVREQLTTWLYKIPKESYWPIGFVARAGEATALLDSLEKLGWGRQDETGAFLVRIPGLSTLVGALSGADYREFRLDSVNPVTPGGSKYWPTLQPGAEAYLEMLTNRAPEELKPALLAISKALTFDEGRPGTTLFSRGVQSVLDLVGAFIPGLDNISPLAYEQVHNQASSQAVQYAMSDLLDEGIAPPDPGAPDAEWTAYHELVKSHALNYEGGNIITRAISNLAFPLSIVSQPRQATAYYAWRDKQGIQYPYTPEDFTKIDAYVKSHPDALPYTIGVYKAIPENQRLLPDDAPFADKLAAGDSTQLDSEDYYTKAVAIMGLKAEESRLRMEMRGASIGSASGQLRDMAAYTTIYGEHLIRMSDWFMQAPEVKAYLSDHESDYTFKQQRVLELNRVIKEVQADGGFSDPEDAQKLLAVQGILGQEMQDIHFGPPGSERQKQLDWWYNNVNQKYKDEINPLYDAVEFYFNSGQDDKAFFELSRIRAINNSLKERTHNGETFPTPELVSFNRLQPDKQIAKVYDWTISRPTSLSNFQMEQVGYPPGMDLLASGISARESEYYRALADPHLTDDQKWSLYHAEQADLAKLAAPLGMEGQTFLRLSQGTPADRLSYRGFGQGVLAWDSLVAESKDIIAYAISKGTPGSYRYASESTGVLDRKIAFERKIQFLRDVDPRLDQLFRSLEVPAAPFNQTGQFDVPLYEHIFFGQSSNAFNYQDPIVAAVELGQTYQGAP